MDTLHKPKEKKQGKRIAKSNRTMSKAEKFIQDYTRNCSNIEYTKGYYQFYQPWLTPDQARRAVEIAREEIIKDVCEWIKKNVYSYAWYDFQQYEMGIESWKLIKDLKQAMKNE